MAKSILVTGVNGFVGRHLARELSSRDVHVIGIGNREPQPHPEIADVISEYYRCNVTDTEQVVNLPLEKVDGIINLAGLANVGASFSNPEEYMKVNVEVLSVLGENLLKRNPDARMIAVSTGAIYDPNQEMPLNEDSRLVSSGSPYALSKLEMEKAARALMEKGQQCIIVRPFNHIGPGQSGGFLVPDLIAKLKAADKTDPELVVGNVKTVRDYTDVRDIARAYADLATSEKEPDHGVYNVCSGSGYMGLDIIRQICYELGIEFDKLKLIEDSRLIRPTDPMRIIGNHDRLTGEIGWEPSIPLEKTIKDALGG